MPRAAASGGTPAHRIIFDGQSLNLISTDAETTYPIFVMEGLSLPYSVVAVGGQSWTSLAGTAPTRLHPYGGTADTLTLVMTGGSSDILDGDTGATVMADAVAYADAARAAGFDNVICTTIPPTIAFDTSESDAKDDFNTLLVADAGSDFDAVVDLRVTDLEDATDSTFYLDGVHWNAAGCEVAGGLAQTALTTVLGL